MTAIRCTPTEFNLLVNQIAPPDQIHLSCPGSRYAYTAGFAAHWAVAEYLIFRYSNAEDSPEALSECMSQVVNDHDDPAIIIHANWFLLPRHIRQALGHSRHEVKRMATQ